MYGFVKCSTIFTVRTALGSWGAYGCSIVLFPSTSTDHLEMSCQICVCLFILIFVFSGQCLVVERHVLIVFESLVAWSFARLTRDLPCHLLCNTYVHVQAKRMKYEHVFA